MKVKLMALLCIFVMASANNAHAVFCNQVICDGGTSVHGCKNGSLVCYPNTGCAVPDELEPAFDDGFGNYYCCTGCTNCFSDPDWSAHTAGYQKKVTKSCSCNTCSSYTSYRCADGYYGTSTNGTTGCTACPVGGTSNAGDNSAITKCYAAPGNGNDGAGYWEYTNICYYSV